MRRRHLLGSAAALMLAPRTGVAQGWPDHPLRFIVPYAPGGSTDTSARIVSEKLAQLLGRRRGREQGRRRDHHRHRDRGAIPSRTASRSC
jgi:hypothetical protein